MDLGGGEEVAVSEERIRGGRGRDPAEERNREGGGREPAAGALSTLFDISAAREATPTETKKRWRGERPGFLFCRGVVW